jgi:hypothetical protein
MFLFMVSTCLWLILATSFKAADSTYRTKWTIHFVPTLIRFERVGGELKETGRLVEGEVLDEKKFRDLVEV